MIDRFGRRSSRSMSCSKNSQLTWTPSPTTTPSSPKRTVDGVLSSKSRLRLARVSPLVSNDLGAPNQLIGLLPLRIDFGIAREGRNQRAQCRAIVLNLQKPLQHPGPISMYQVDAGMKQMRGLSRTKLSLPATVLGFSASVAYANNILRFVSATTTTKN